MCSSLLNHSNPADSALSFFRKELLASLFQLKTWQKIKVSWSLHDKLLVDSRHREGMWRQCLFILFFIFRLCVRHQHRKSWPHLKIYIFLNVNCLNWGEAWHFLVCIFFMICIIYFSSNIRTKKVAAAASLNITYYSKPDLCRNTVVICAMLSQTLAQVKAESYVL